MEETVPVNSTNIRRILQLMSGLISTYAYLYKLGYCGKVSVADMSQNQQTMRNASKF
jgi:hypothetical protein